MVSQDGYLRKPVGIVYADGKLYVTETAGGRILSVSSETGAQEIIAEGGFLTTPVGLALLDDNTLLIGDPDCNDFVGALIAVDLEDGAQECIVRGFGEFMNPRGIAVMQASTSEFARGH